jgi:hypothetical protein
MDRVIELVGGTCGWVELTTIPRGIMMKTGVGSPPEHWRRTET